MPVGCLAREGERCSWCVAPPHPRCGTPFRTATSPPRGGGEVWVVVPLDSSTTRQADEKTGSNTSPPPRGGEVGPPRRRRGGPGEGGFRCRSRKPGVPGVVCRLHFPVTIFFE